MPELPMQVTPQKAGGEVAQAPSIRGGLGGLVALKNHIGTFPVRGVQSGEQQRRVQSSCSPGDPFSVTSSVYPNQEGCYTIFEDEPGSVTYATEDFVSFISEIARDQGDPDSLVSCITNSPPPFPREEGGISGNASSYVRSIENTVPHEPAR